MKLFIVAISLLALSGYANESNPFDKFIGCYKITEKRCWFENRSLECPTEFISFFIRKVDSDRNAIFPYKIPQGFNSNSGMIEYSYTNHDGSLESASFKTDSNGVASWTRLTNRNGEETVTRYIELSKDSASETFNYLDNDNGMKFSAKLVSHSFDESCY